MHAASAQIGVAVAAQLPQFTLAGNAGTTANQISQLFITPGTAFWTVAGNVAQTVFDAGTLLHKKRAADAAFDQAAAYAAAAARGYTTAGPSISSKENKLLNRTDAAVNHGISLIDRAYYSAPVPLPPAG